MKNLSSNDKKCVYGIILSCVIMMFGILFLVNAMGVANFYKSYAAIKNPLAKYLVVILVMATGIMLFSNVALRFEDDKLRKRLTIFITAFAFILTIPLTYVLIAMLPFHAKYNMADVENAIDAARLAHPEYTTAQVNEAAGKALGLSGFGNIMGVHTIYEGFEMWFKDGAFIWVVFVFMAILGVVFLIEPLAAGICVVKGKILLLFSKDENGKFHLFRATELPVLKKRRENEIYERAA